MVAATETMRFLPFLTPAEESVLLTEAPVRSFKPGEVVLAQNLTVRAIYLIETGLVRVERQEHGERVRLAGLGAGEFFGEMSFVDAGPTSASVVAEEETRVRLIDEATVDRMTKADPSFSGRLFRSIAAILSERLRLTSMHVDTLIAGIDFYSGIRAEIEAASAKLPGPDWRSDLVFAMQAKEDKR
jgi:CRP-like cAMP-binding protein